MKVLAKLIYPALFFIHALAELPPPSLHSPEDQLIMLVLLNSGIPLETYPEEMMNHYLKQQGKAPSHFNRSILRSSARSHLGASPLQENHNPLLVYTPLIEKFSDELGLTQASVDRHSTLLHKGKRNTLEISGSTAIALLAVAIVGIALWKIHQQESRLNEFMDKASEELSTQQMQAQLAQNSAVTLHKGLENTKQIQQVALETREKVSQTLASQAAPFIALVLRLELKTRSDHAALTKITGTYVDAISALGPLITDLCIKLTEAAAKQASLSGTELRTYLDRVKTIHTEAAAAGTQLRKSLEELKQDPDSEVTKLSAMAFEIFENLEKANGILNPDENTQLSPN